MTDRRDKILSGIDLRASTGAEIGPLHQPLVLKSQSDVKYVDHCDTETLKKRWETDPNVDTSTLHVDAVWGKNTLREALVECMPSGSAIQLNYVVASHVIEHVPDLITWLKEIHAVLRADGTLRLAIPDRRFTFDYLRRTSNLTDVLEAYVLKRRVPGASRVLDFTLNMADVDCGKAWDGKIVKSELVKKYPLADAMALAMDAERNGTYHDVHCWVFTPESFAELCCEMAEADQLNFECERFVQTEHNQFEFFVGMRPSDSKTKIVGSWKEVLSQFRE